MSNETKTAAFPPEFIVPGKPPMAGPVLREIVHGVVEELWRSKVGLAEKAAEEKAEKVVGASFIRAEVGFHKEFRQWARDELESFWKGKTPEAENIVIHHFEKLSRDQSERRARRIGWILSGGGIAIVTAAYFWIQAVVRTETKTVFDAEWAKIAAPKIVEMKSLQEDMRNARTDFAKTEGSLSGRLTRADESVALLEKKLTEAELALNGIKNKSEQVLETGRYQQKAWQGITEDGAKFQQNIGFISDALDKIIKKLPAPTLEYLNQVSAGAASEAEQQQLQSKIRVLPVGTLLAVSAAQADVLNHDEPGVWARVTEEGTTIPANSEYAQQAKDILTNNRLPKLSDYGKTWQKSTPSEGSLPKVLLIKINNVRQP